MMIIRAQLILDYCGHCRYFEVKDSHIDILADIHKTFAMII